MTEDRGRLIASVEIAESRCTALEAVIKKLRVETAAYSATAEKLEARVRKVQEIIANAEYGNTAEQLIPDRDEIDEVRARKNMLWQSLQAIHAALAEPQEGKS